MKKIFLMLIVFGLFLLPALCLAGMTCELIAVDAWGKGRWAKITTVKITAVQEGASALAEANLSDISGCGFDTSDPVNVWNKDIKNSIFYQVEAEPGSNAPAAPWDLSFDTDRGADLFAKTSLSESAATAPISVSAETGGNFVVRDLQITFGDLGTTNDSAIVYLTFVK